MDDVHRGGRRRRPGLIKQRGSSINTPRRTQRKPKQHSLHGIHTRRSTPRVPILPPSPLYHWFMPPARRGRVHLLVPSAERFQGAIFVLIDLSRLIFGFLAFWRWVGLPRKCAMDNWLISVPSSAVRCHCPLSEQLETGQQFLISRWWCRMADDVWNGCTV